MQELKCILASTDLSKLSLAGVRYALELGEKRRARVILYNVLDVETDWLSGREDLNPAAVLLPRQKKKLSQWVKDHCAEFAGRVDMSLVVEVGRPYKRIVQYAAENGADLIVIATHGRSGVDQFLLGSVTQKVVSQAPCPVLSIKPQRRRRDRSVGTEA